MTSTQAGTGDKLDIIIGVPDDDATINGVKGKALDGFKLREQHFWDVVSRSDDPTISVADAADALGISKYRLRGILADSRNDLGFSIKGHGADSMRNDCVILRSKLIRYFFR